MFLDGLIVAGSLFLVSWVTILGPIYAAEATDRLLFVVSLAYPVSDVVVLTLAAVVLVRSGPEHRLTLTLLTVGLACIALSDSLFTYLSTKNEYASGDVIDIGWAAGLLLIAVAAAASRQTTHENSEAPELPGWASIWLPYAPLLLAAIVAAAKPSELLRSQPVEVIAGLLVLAVLARQFLAVSENRRLLATVAEQALRDPLTGLANRALFNERLDQGHGTARTRRRHRRGGRGRSQRLQARQRQPRPPGGDDLLVVWPAACSTRSGPATPSAGWAATSSLLSSRAIRTRRI